MVSATYLVSNKRALSTAMLLMVLAVAAGLASCDDGPTVPGSEGDPTVLFPGFTVSEPDGQAAGAALSAAAPGEAYVSAAPGTFPGAETITIANLASGATQSVTPQDGGFDPVAVEAEVGDQLEIVVSHTDGSTSRYVAIVPARKRPRIVRTMPTRDATDVVLSASIVIVFSEPVDASTITAETFVLRLDGEPVDGALGLSDDDLRAEFTRTELLDAGAAYSLLITTGVLDVAGDSLDEQLEMTFTTGITVEIQLCAKQSVLKEINRIDEPWPDHDPGWRGWAVNSTDPNCGAWSGYSPHGTFRYKTEGPRFEWQFEGEGFVPTIPYPVGDRMYYIHHRYQVILYRDPWPGLNLVCLGEGRPPVADGETQAGTLSLRSSHDFHGDLTNAKIWIIGSSQRPGAADVVPFEDCTGRAFEWWTNEYGVPRLTNDRNEDGKNDASASGHHCWGPPIWCTWEMYTFYYDWLFETALVNYHETDSW